VKVIENELNGHLIRTITGQREEISAIFKRLQMLSFGKNNFVRSKTIKLPSITLRELKD